MMTPSPIIASTRFCYNNMKKKSKISSVSILAVCKKGEICLVIQMEIAKGST